MDYSELISRLDGYRETGRSQGVGRCPAHDDRSPSLSVKGEADGRILIHCFAGCETVDVLAALGLTFPDVMPEPVPGHRHKSVRHRINPRAALELIDHHALVVAIIANDFMRHRELDEPTWDKLAESVSRINLIRAEVAPARVKA